MDKIFKIFISLCFVTVFAACESIGGKGGGSSSSGSSYGSGQDGKVPVYTAGSLEEFNNVLGDRVFFSFDSHTVNAQGQELLRRQAEWLKRYSNYTVLIEGHADERGTREYNLALGALRANAAAAVLITNGISPDRIDVISYGKEHPAVIGSTESAWKQNRRAVLILQ